MSVNVPELKFELERSHSELMSVLTTLSSVSAPSSNPTWDARDLAAHLTGAKVGMLARIRQAEGGRAGLPDGFDLDRWNQRQVEKRRDKTLEELAAELNQAHHELMELLETSSEDALDMAAEHPVAGPTTVRGILQIIYRHEREHLAEIHAALSAQR